MLLSGCRRGVTETDIVEYPVHTVGLADKTLQTSYPATVRGRQDIEIYPQVSGRITEVRITEGQKVKKGDVLFVIDQVPYKAALQSAIADWEVANRLSEISGTITLYKALGGGAM